MVKRKEKKALRASDYLDEDQQNLLITHVIKQARHRKPGSLRALTNQIIVLVLLSTGLRASELLGLKKRDLPCCHGKSQIDVPAEIAKNEQSRTIIIPVELGDLMSHYMDVARKGSRPGSLFLVNERGGPMSYKSLWSKIDILKRKIGLPFVTAHKLRHSHITDLYNVAYDLRCCQDQAGHSSIKTTQIYTRTANKGRISQVERLPIAGMLAQLSESITQKDKCSKAEL